MTQEDLTTLQIQVKHTTRTIVKGVPVYSCTVVGPYETKDIDASSRQELSNQAGLLARSMISAAVNKECGYIENRDMFKVVK